MEYGAWLAAPVINFYCKKYLVLDQQENFYIFGSDVYGKLLMEWEVLKRKKAEQTKEEKKEEQQKDDEEEMTKKWYEKCRRSTSRFDWTAFQYVFFPICEKLHWSMIIVEAPSSIRPVYYHLDSLKGCHSSRSIIRLLEDFISLDLVKKMTASEKKKREPEEIFVATNPQQNNSNDCGVYMLWYMRKISKEIRDKSPKTLQDSIQCLASGCNFSFSNQLRDEVKKLVKDSRFVFTV